jgi:hypothetical protein
MAEKAQNCLFVPHIVAPYMGKSGDFCHKWPHMEAGFKLAETKVPEHIWKSQLPKICWRMVYRLGNWLASTKTKATQSQKVGIRISISVIRLSPWILTRKRFSFSLPSSISHLVRLGLSSPGLAGDRTLISTGFLLCSCRESVIM